MGVFKKVNRLTPNPSIFNATTDASVTLPIGDNVYRNLSQFSSKSAVTKYYDESDIEGDQRPMKVFCYLEEPFQNSSTGTWVRRSEFDTRNNLLKTREIYWSESFYVPTRIESSEEKNILGGINMQWHSGLPNDENTTSSPYFTISFENGRIVVKLRMGPDGFASNYMWFDIGPATRDTWHHLEIFHEKYYTNGHLAIFYNGAVAKLHNPLTGEPWVVPTTSQSGISDLWIAYPVKGNLPASIGGASLLDWFGKTYYDTDTLNMYWKSGFYRSQELGGMYDSGGNPINTTDPSQSNYIEPGSYKEIWFKNVNFATKLEEETFESIYKELNINGESPDIDPELHPWFTRDPQTEGPFDINVTSQTGGTVSATKNSEPITFPATLEEDEEVVLTATPNNENWEFTGWFEGSELVSSNNPYTFTMPDRNVNLEARFQFIGVVEGNRFFARFEN